MRMWCERFADSHLLPFNPARLPHPLYKLPLIHRLALMHMQIPRARRFGPDGRHGFELGAAEEGDFDEFRISVHAQEPAVSRHAKQRRVPFDGFLHGGDSACDQRVKAARGGAFPARGCHDPSLNRRVPIAFGDLRIAAREKDRFVRRFCHDAENNPVTLRRKWLETF
jgi:hypothetical protein